MLFTKSTLLAAIALGAAASSVALRDSDGTLPSVLSRVFRPEKTADRLFYKASNITEPDCPSYNFKYEEARKLESNSNTYVVPHTKILADNVRCGRTGGSDEYVWLIPSGLLADERSAELGDVKDVYDMLTQNTRFWKAFLNLVNVDPMFVGVEMGDRYCGDTLMWAKNSAFIFIEAERKLINFGSYGWIHDGEVAMLGYHAPVGVARSILCIYKDTTKPAPDATPIPSPPPVPQQVASPSPNAFGIFDGGVLGSSTTQPPSSTESATAAVTSSQANSGQSTTAASESSGTTTSGGGVPTSTTTSPPSTSSTNQSDSDDDSACFPGLATVQLESGETVRMDKVKIGDRVRVAEAKFSEVFMFTHKISDNVRRLFIHIQVSSGDWIAASPSHYLFVNGALRPASRVQVGDFLTLGDGRPVRAMTVSNALLKGLYNPQTVDGNIVVNNILSSTYTTAVPPSVAHVLLAPLRAVYKMGFRVDFGLFHKQSFEMLKLFPRPVVSSIEECSIVKGSLAL